MQILFWEVSVCGRSYIEQCSRTILYLRMNGFWKRDELVTGKIDWYLFLFSHYKGSLVQGESSRRVIS